MDRLFEVIAGSVGGGRFSRRGAWDGRVCQTTLEEFGDERVLTRLDVFRRHGRESVWVLLLEQSLSKTLWRDPTFYRRQDLVVVEMMPEPDAGRALPSERLLRRVGAAVLTAVASADEVFECIGEEEHVELELSAEGRVGFMIAAQMRCNR